MNNILRHIFRVAVFILLQWLLVNNLHWLGAFHPYIYILALIMLPASLPRWAEMLIGAVVGLLMDVLCSTAGVHMAATVAVAYVRPLLLDRLIQDAQRIATQVCSITMGNWQYFTTLAVMIILHHTLVFLLEAWSMQHIAWLLLTTLMSSVVTFIVGFLYDRTQR